MLLLLLLMSEAINIDATTTTTDEQAVRSADYAIAQFRFLEVHT